MANLNRAFVKTPKGIEEVERKAHGLAIKPRQVLIMIDGKRDVKALQGIFPPEMVSAVFDELLAGGFIRELEVAAPIAETPAGDDLEAIRDAMSSALYEVFGPDADNFTGKIDDATTRDELAELAAKYEETVASMGGRKKAALFGQHVRGAGLEFVSRLAPKLAEPSAQLPPPALAKPNLAAFKAAMTGALMDALGPDADAFTGKVDTAGSLAEIEALAARYADVIAGAGGRKKAEAFVGKLRQAGIKLGPETAPATPSSPVFAESAKATPKPQSDKERLAMARTFMINTTNTFVGAMGAPLVIEMEKSADLRALRALYYDWRAALQTSPTGKQRLPDLESRLAALLS